MKDFTFSLKGVAVVFFVLLFLFIASSSAVFAETKVLPGDQLVPCGTKEVPCTACHLVVLVIRLINYGVVYLATPLALLMLTYAGFVFATAGGSESRVTAGKKVLWNTLIGLLIIYGAYFLVDTAIKVATGDAKNFRNLPSWVGPWNAPSIMETCGQLEPPPKGPPGTIEASTSKLLDAIVKIANAVGSLLMMLSVLMVMYSAYLFVTGGGNEKQLTSARNILVYAIVGIVIALFAFTLPSVAAYIIIQAGGG